MEIMDEYKLEVFKDYFDSGEVRKFRELMMYYECAMLEVKTKLDVLNKELALKKCRNPFESIKCRIKTPESIMEKLIRKGIDFTVENIERELNDIAGIRVICSFPDDIYELIDYLIKQDDIRLITIKDYIKNPKPNGYRSYHVIIAVPVYYLDTMEYFPVEIQLRTMTMDLWASMEHRVCYKKLPEHREELAEAFCQYADILGKIDEQFEAYNETGMLEEITTSEVVDAPAEG